MPDSIHLAAALSPAHQRRLKWALRGMSQALVTALQRDRSPEAAQIREADPHDQAEMVSRLIMGQADPTSNKRFTAWLVREFAAGRLILEDLGTANETLTLFQRYAPRLGPELRDIQRHRNLAAAWDAVRGFAEREEAHSNKAQRALDRARAYAESRILRQDPDGFTVAVPLTMFAAKWWGKGTRWCTAAERNNQFCNYHETAPLIVIIIPTPKGARKLQLWVTPQEVFFMDASDSPVTPSIIQRYWSYLKPIMLHTTHISGEFLGQIPPQAISSDLCLAVAKNSEKGAKYIPQELLTREICETLVVKNENGLLRIPTFLWRPELLEMAVKHHWAAINHIPCRMISLDLMRSALEQNWQAIKRLPFGYQTRNGLQTKTAPTPEWFKLIEDAVAQSGLALEFVPEGWRDALLIEKAVRQDGRAIKYVSSRHLNEYICRLAIQQNPKVISLIPASRLTKELCEIALQGDGTLLKYVPSKILNEALCHMAVVKNGLALEWAPWGWRSQDRCLIAVSQDGRALAFVPPDQKTPELCQVAVKNDGRAIEHVPGELISYDLCRLAVFSSKGLLCGPLRFIPRCFHSQELCEEAVKRDPWEIITMPEKLLTLEMCRDAILQDPCLMDLMPKHIYAPLKAELFAPAVKPAAERLTGHVDWNEETLDAWAEALKPVGNPDLNSQAKTPG